MLSPRSDTPEWCIVYYRRCWDICDYFRHLRRQVAFSLSFRFPLKTLLRHATRTHPSLLSPSGTALAVQEALFTTSQRDMVRYGTTNNVSLY